MWFFFPVQNEEYWLYFWIGFSFLWLWSCRSCLMQFVSQRKRSQNIVAVLFTKSKGSRFNADLCDMHCSVALSFLNMSHNAHFCVCVCKWKWVDCMKFCRVNGTFFFLFFWHYKMRAMSSCLKTISANRWNIHVSELNEGKKRAICVVTLTHRERERLNYFK